MTTRPIVVFCQACGTREKWFIRLNEKVLDARCERCFGKAEVKDNLTATDFTVRFVAL